MQSNLDTIKEHALEEFAALEQVSICKESCKRKAKKDFRKSIDAYFSLMEFEKNGKYFKSKMYKPSTIKTVYFGTVNTNHFLSPISTKWYYNVSPVKKKTLTFKDTSKAHRRVSPFVTKYVRLFSQALDGITVTYGNDFVKQCATYEISQYESCIERSEPTKEQLFRTFLTWIRSTENTTRAEAVMIFASFNIPSIKKNEIPYRWKEIQPTSITFRTFEI